MRNHEVVTKQPLLKEDGSLREPGGSKSLVQTYDRKQIKAPRMRIKEWDYYPCQMTDILVCSPCLC